MLGALKADRELASTPVILYTGMANERSKAFRLGVSEFMAKPDDPNRLASVLKRYSGDSAGRVLVVDDDPDQRRPGRR